MRLVNAIIQKCQNVFEIDSYLSSIEFGDFLIFKVVLTSKNADFQTSNFNNTHLTYSPFKVYVVITNY